MADSGQHLCDSCQRCVSTLADERQPAADAAAATKFRVVEKSAPESVVQLVRECVAGSGGGLAERSSAVCEQLERRFGGVWNAVVGEDFAASVFFGANTFLHCRVNEVSFVVFSWHPLAPADQRQQQQQQQHSKTAVY